MGEIETPDIQERWFSDFHEALSFVAVFQPKRLALEKHGSLWYLQYERGDENE